MVTDATMYTTVYSNKRLIVYVNSKWVTFSNIKTRQAFTAYFSIFLKTERIKIPSLVSAYLRPKNHLGLPDIRKSISKLQLECKLSKGMKIVLKVSSIL